MTLGRGPQLAHLAQRSAIVGRFIAGAHVDRSDAERWVKAWESRANQLGFRPDTPAYWSTGLRWIATQRELGAFAAPARRVS